MRRSVTGKTTNRKLPSLEELVTDFQQNYGRGRLRSCLVCNSPNLSLINILLRGGAGGPSVSRYLRERLGESIGQAVIGRHKAEHLDAETEDR